MADTATATATGTAPFTMTIDGKAVAGESTFGVINPATGEVFAEAPDCTRGQLDRAMEAANRAYKTWSRDVAKRREVLNACAKALQDNANEIAPILTREQGKPLTKATEEIMAAAVWFQYVASLEIPVEVIQDNEEARIELHRRPLGVVGAITPWNFPLLLATWKIAPALLAGNTIVVKPSPFTPLATLKVGEILRDVAPAGVINTISGGDRLGAWITEHPTVRKISFTGSIETGKKVAAAAAPDLKRVTLELGGNDAALVLPGTDPGEVAEKIFWGAFENTGQICSCIKRVYVHKDQYRPLVDAMIEIARGVKMGDGLEEGTRLGPLNNEMQFNKVTELVEDAKKHGAKIGIGGKAREGKGYFYEPTILSEVGDDARIVAEEQFGPALPILPYDDVDEAVERANATMYGLSGSVWGPDADEAAEVAGRLECGTAWVNQHLSILPYAPFGGAKWSGIGVENGPWGLLGFTEIQVVNAAKG